jgi:flagellar biosynthesis protein FliR
MYPIGITLDDVYKMMLLMFRTGALLSTVPIFGHQSIPRILRVWLIMLLAVMLLPASSLAGYEPPATLFHLVTVILGELAIGFTMGFAIIVFFSAVQFAGHFIGLEMGLAVANVMDPMSAGQISIIGEFYYLVSILIFLMIDGHHMVIEALAQSFRVIPIAGGSFPPALGSYISSLTFNVFVLAVKLSAPIVITLFIVNIVLGIVARTVPQMNVFIVGFPLAIAVGLIMIYFSMPFFKDVLVYAFNALGGDISRLIGFMAG